MRYIKLFEAFESIILSNTLKYLKNNVGKNEFLNVLKEACKTLDIPFSKLSDEYFEYLPFKTAIKKNITKKCQATSREAFPDHYVEDEVCNDGRIKRKWGNNTRIVECPICGGTGKLNLNELSLFKFWFSSSGEYVGLTVINGRNREPSRALRKQWSEDLKDYSEEKVISVHELKTGDFIKINIGGGGRGGIVAMAWVDDNRHIYALQNQKSGNVPNGNEWSKYAAYSWSIAGGDYIGNIVLLKPNSYPGLKLDAEQIKDDYLFNIKVRTDRYPLSPNTNLNLSDIYENADFAIIFDYYKLKSEKSKFKLKSEIIKTRQDRKKDSRVDPDQADDMIRRKNIEKYMETLSEKIDVPSDIINCNKYVNKILNNRYAVYLVLLGSTTSNFDTIISRYYDFLSDSSSENLKYLSYSIKEFYKQIFNQRLRIKSALDRLQTEEPEKFKVFNDAMININTAIIKKISEIKIETIDDFEIFNYKLCLIRDIIKSSRHSLNGIIYSVYNYIPDNVYRSIQGLSSINSDQLDRIPALSDRICSMISKV